MTSFQIVFVFFSVLLQTDNNPSQNQEQRNDSRNFSIHYETKHGTARRLRKSSFADHTNQASTRTIGSNLLCQTIACGKRERWLAGWLAEPGRKLATGSRAPSCNSRRTQLVRVRGKRTTTAGREKKLLQKYRKPLSYPLVEHESVQKNL